MTPWWGGHSCYSHFTDDKTETQEVYVLAWGPSARGSKTQNYVHSGKTLWLVQLRLHDSPLPNQLWPWVGSRCVRMASVIPILWMGAHNSQERGYMWGRDTPKRRLLYTPHLCTKFRSWSISSEPVLREDLPILDQSGSDLRLPSQQGWNVRLGALTFPARPLCSPALSLDYPSGYSPPFLKSE